MGTRIGYWASEKRWTKTHLVEDGKPKCGSHVGENLTYQWCSNSDSPYDYIECEHCKKIARKKLIAAMNKVTTKNVKGQQRRNVIHSR